MDVIDDLAVFVREGLSRGVSRPDIERVLLQAGWRAEQVTEALRTYADVPFPIPVPRPRPYQSARDAFMCLSVFATLYISAYSLGALVFGLIDTRFPPAGHATPAMLLAQIRWSVAWLVATVPVFVFMRWRTARDIARDPTKRDSRIRRQITYVTLFIASATLLGDVTTLVYNLLAGETTISFVLKVLTVAAIAGGALWYYLGDIRDTGWQE